MNQIKKDRYLEIDLLRTIAIFMMVVYHLSFDLAYFYEWQIDPLSGWLLVLQRITAILFLILVGISFSISYGNMQMKKASKGAILGKYFISGLKLLILGGIISTVTYFAIGAEYIRFGILHMIGISLLLAPFFMPLKEANLLLAAVAWYAGGFVSGFQTFSPWLLPFGVVYPGFASVDFFPLFPWFSAILAGLSAGNFLYNRGFLKNHLILNRFTLAITEPGRRSLAIYLIHQPVILGIIYLLNFAFSG